jgi:predicted AAA+ superfamily ATPase
MCDAFLFYKVKYYDIRGKQIMKTKVKYYATDLGMLTLKTSSNIGFNKRYRLENAVLLKLLEERYEVYTAENEAKHEIDFVIKKDNEIKYIQVCDVLNDKNFTRESTNLLSVKDAYDKYIITNSISVSSTQGIKILILSDFLLGKTKINN